MIFVTAVVKRSPATVAGHGRREASGFDSSAE